MSDADQAPVIPGGTIEGSGNRFQRTSPFTNERLAALMRSAMQGGTQAGNFLPGHFQVARTQQDIDTENRARIADQLNNQMFYDPSIIAGGRGGIQNLHRGSIQTPPEFQTEDQRLQELRRAYESERRSFEGGLAQEGRMFDQNMALLQDYRTWLNNLMKAPITADVVASEQDPTRRMLMTQMMGLSPDGRSQIARIIDYFFAPIEDMMRTGGANSINSNAAGAVGNTNMPDVGIGNVPAPGSIPLQTSEERGFD